MPSPFILPSALLRGCCTKAYLAIVELIRSLNFSCNTAAFSITKFTFKLFRCTSSTGCTTQVQVTNVILSKSTNGLKATLNPFGMSSTLLAARTRYKAVVITGATDLAGNRLDQNTTLTGNQQKTWTFTTKG